MGGKNSKADASPADSANKAASSETLAQAAAKTNRGEFLVDDREKLSDDDKVRLNTDISQLQDGRYRIASQETIDGWKLTQGKSSSKSRVGLEAEGLPGTPAERDRLLKKAISESEGLDIGFNERRKLSQQWRFFLASEPIQRGLDAGLVCGSISAVGFATKAANRKPIVLACAWAGGFCVGMVTLPVAVMALEAVNQRRIKGKEGEMFAKQRQAFITQNQRQES